MTTGPPVAWAAFGFVSGAALHFLLPAGSGLLAAALLVVPLGLWIGPKSTFVAVAAAFAAGAGWRGAHEASLERCRREAAAGRAAAIEGYFAVARLQGASSFVRTGAPRSACAKVRVYLAGRGAPPAAGAPLRIPGEWGLGRGLSPVFFARAEDAKAAEAEVPLVARWTARARERASLALERRIPERAGMAKALSLADRDGISPELREAFARAGIAHLLAISGFHVGIVGLLWGLFLAALKATFRARAILVPVVVWAYVALIGAPTSAVRAAWMISALSVGRIKGVPVHPLGALACAALVMTLVDPSVASHAGFQLTLTGVLGILFADRWARRRLTAARGWLGRTLQAAAVGAGASVFTAPVLAIHFGEIPLLSLPSSLALTPLVVAAVPGIFAAAALDILGLPGASVAGGAADTLLSFLAIAAKALAQIPHTVVSASPLEATLLTGGALLSLFLLRMRPRASGGLKLLVAVLSAVSALHLGEAAQHLLGRGRLELSAIDVGQGDALAIRTPMGRWMLIDAGPAYQGGDAGQRRVVPFLRARGATRLETVLLTHSDQDHAGGLASVLRAFRAGSVLGPGTAFGQSGHAAGVAAARAENIPWRRVHDGVSWRTDGVLFEVLGPDAQAHLQRDIGPNELSVILLATYAGVRILLMGDANKAAEDRILDRLEQSDILKVGHHGSRTSTGDAFLERVRPDHAIISAGRRNRHGHPAPEVIEALESRGVLVHRTDLHGTVRVLVDASGRVTVSRARGAPEA